jgi:hypothetical protein
MRLAKGGVISLSPGAVVSVERGLLWVTQYPDRNDYLLTAGQSMRLGGRGAVLGSALRDSQFVVLAPEPVGRPWLRFLAGLAARRRPMPA